MAYENVRKAKCNIIKTEDFSSLDGDVKKKINFISDRLKNEKFKFGIGRRIRISKKRGSKCLLTMLSAWDKVVCTAIKFVLEYVYEGLDYFKPNNQRRKKSPGAAIFRTFSHGFRPNRSCHSALRFVKN